MGPDSLETCQHQHSKAETMEPIQYVTLMALASAWSTELFEYDDPETLYAYLDNITRSYPDTTTLINLGLSFDNRSIYCLKISKGEGSEGTIIAEFGAHAREWVSQTSATHAIHELLHNARYDELTRRISWFIIPLLNPDGYHYSKTVDRLWRKNRRPNDHPDLECVGVDVNRNFPVKWDYVRNYCDQCYGGPQPFSESESMAIRRLFELIPDEDVDVYVSVHSDAQCIIIPYAYTHDPPKGHTTLYSVATKMKNAMESVGFPKYDVLQAAELYVAAGTVFDWVYDCKSVPMVFTVELPFNDVDHDPFNASTREMEVIADQCMAALVVCATEIISSKEQKKNMSIITNQSRSFEQPEFKSILANNHTTFRKSCTPNPIERHVAAANTIVVSVIAILPTTLHII